MYKIEKNVEMPKEVDGRGAKAKYPFENLKLGESFFAPGVDAKDLSNVSMYWKRKLKRNYTVRTVTDEGVSGSRAWRTE
tara:strand:- start:2082 stop:2318 length:237 start_codon:yes stop_codon:yes gene_type:complete